MKRFFTFLFIAFGTFPLLFSQVKMTKASHGFLTDLHHECQAVQYQDPGSSGENLVWDYSHVTVLEELKSVSDLEETEGNIKAMRNDGCDFFFKNTDNANEYWGYKAGTVKLQFVKPIVKTQYPQVYNTQFSGKYEGLVTIEGSECISHVEGTYSTHADATGTIILPDNISLPALRVRTTETNHSHELVKYLWYAQDVRFPLFVTMEEYSIAADGTQTLLVTKSYMNTKINVPSKTTTSICTPLSADFSYKIAPNPFKNEISLSYFLPEQAKVTVEMYDSQGVKLAVLLDGQTQIGHQTILKDVSKYAQLSGIYFLKIIVNDKTYTEKLIKS